MIMVDGNINDNKFKYNNDNDNGNKGDAIIRLIGITDTILPTIDNDGNVVYPILDELSITIDMLEEAVKDGMLEKRVYNKIPICPIHNKVLKHIVLHCPECNSKDIKKMHLIEHITCGFIGEKNKFRIDSNRLVCPSCNTIITEKNSNMLGVWYVCNRCLAKFNSPILMFACDDHTLDITSIDIIEIFYYTSIRGIISTEHDMNEMMESLYQTLERKNLNVRKMHAMKGRSGVTHTVSMYIDDYSGSNIIIECCIKDSDDKTFYNNVMATIIKMTDLRARQMILICVPKIIDELRSMATANNIMVIEGNNRNRILATILDIVNSKILNVDSR
ncbi:MAG: hypothetical protein ACK4FV_06780 [Candidatus Nitrosocaldus sp.]